MARTNLTKTTAPGRYSTTGAAVTMAAADIVDKNQFVASGNDVIIAHNTGAAPATVTITSAADPYGRTGDVEAVGLGLHVGRQAEADGLGRRCIASYGEVEADGGQLLAQERCRLLDLGPGVGRDGYDGLRGEREGRVGKDLEADGLGVDARLSLGAAPYLDGGDADVAAVGVQREHDLAGVHA